MAHASRSALNARHSDDELAYEQLRDTWLNRRREQYVASVLAAVRPGARVLEIGSGTGYLLLELASRRPDLAFKGIDPLPNYVELARRRARERHIDNLVFSTGYAESLDEDLEQHFDAILSNDTLHHVDDVARTAQALYSIASPGALWLAIEPSPLNPYVAVRHAAEPGERNFRPGRFTASAQRAGWTVVGRRHLFAIPPAVRRPPGWLVHLERRVERFPGIAGGLALLLVRQPAQPARDTSRKSRA